MHLQDVEGLQGAGCRGQGAGCRGQGAGGRVQTFKMLMKPAHEVTLRAAGKSWERDRDSVDGTIPRRLMATEQLWHSESNLPGR